MLHSGIDLHKRDLVIATVDAEGHAVREARLATSRAAVTAYFASLAGPHRAAVESTASWYWLADHLRAAGVDVRLGHSKYIKAISYAKVKTDRVDARTLAQLLRAGLSSASRLSLPARSPITARHCSLRPVPEHTGSAGRAFRIYSEITWARRPFHRGFHRGFPARESLQ